MTYVAGIHRAVETSKACKSFSALIPLQDLDMIDVRPSQNAWAIDRPRVTKQEPSSKVELRRVMNKGG